MALNAHSTGVMALLGKLVGNTMAYVSPSNLKLIGRATNVINMHVRRRLPGSAAVAALREISYAEINAVLFDAIAFVKAQRATASAAAAATAAAALVGAVGATDVAANQAPAPFRSTSIGAETAEVFFNNNNTFIF
jgi:N-acetylmuramic acid 6-phosphate etherase